LGGAIFKESGIVTISHSILTDKAAGFVGGGLCNGGWFYSGGTVTVEKSSTILGNAPDDVKNAGTLYLHGCSTIDSLDGTAAIAIP
jgi:hypothetical protein